MDVFFVVIQLIFLEGILSLDNAAVLGALAARLPDDQPIPLPTSLHFLAPIAWRVLGMQQTAVLRIGLLFAYLGRALLLLAATWIAQSVVLETIGAIYLIWLGWKNVRSRANPEPTPPAALSTHNFWLLVLQIELIDLVFSLDNVIAAVALSSDYWVVLLGVAIGILFMRFAAGLFAQLVQREPVLETAAYLIIIAIGGELLLSEFGGITLLAWQKLVISLGIIAACLLYGRFTHVSKRSSKN